MIGLVLIAVCLSAAVARPLGMSEAIVAAPCVGLALLTGAASWSAATDTLRQLAPTVAFLAAILAFGALCASAGVFDYLGGLAARASGGSARRLLGLIVGLAAAVTAVLTLDATIVLVTPVVLATAARLGVAARPHSYACARLANSGSLLLPVSNLTNLLAFAASGLSFGRFAAAMALPWALACALDWSALRVWFRRDLTADATGRAEPSPAPVFALVVLCATVAGFVLTTAAGVPPAWAALAGAVVLATGQLRRRRTNLGRIVLSASPGFCVFVFSLGVLVAGVLDRGAGDWLRSILPTGTGLPALIGLALIAAVLANLVNNLPTTLALAPLVAGSPLAVLAVLIGVNLGPNASYGGSLATLLWRRSLPAGQRPRAAEFHALGLVTVPLAVCAVTTAMWLTAGPLGLR